MAKNLTITLLFLFCTGIGFSQSGFRKGYVIMNSNDTIFGLIKSGTKRDNMLKCEFKESEKSKKITYLPESIKAYRFTDGKYYISGSVDSAKTEKVFLEYLIDGIVDIYYVNDEIGDHYFISKNDKFSELQNQTIRSYRVTPEAGVSKSYSESSPLLYEHRNLFYKF